jgi:hypothetical protein
MMSRCSPPGQSQQIPKKKQVGNVAEFYFCIWEKDAPKLEFGRKYSLKVCIDLHCKIPTLFMVRKNISMGLKL